MRSLIFVGCNLGEDVFREVDRHDVVWLFEPIPEVASMLMQFFYSRKYASKSIQVINAACWTETCRRPFRLYNETNGLSSSLGTMSDNAVATYREYDLALIDEIEVDCVRLGDYMPAWLDDLIIDAQGADLAILRTVEPWLIEGRIGTIKIECDGEGFRHYDGLPDNSENELLRYMSSFPYSGNRDSGTVPHNPDYLFRRTEKT